MLVLSWRAKYFFSPSTLISACHLAFFKYHPSELAASDGADDNKGLHSRRDRVGQRRIRRLMRQILLAGEEAQERAPLLRNMIADGAAQHRVAGLERVEH